MEPRLFLIFAWLDVGENIPSLADLDKIGALNSGGLDIDVT